MPVYEYKCTDHGVFYELATIDDSSNPCDCPRCGQPSARIIRLSPEIFNMNKNKKHAYAVNKKNQHEPTMSSAARRSEDTQHAKGCGCEKKLSKSKMLLTTRGEKIFPSMRPWMISH